MFKIQKDMSTRTKVNAGKPMCLEADNNGNRHNILQLEEAVLVVIEWYLDLQLPMQSTPITTKVVSSNTVCGEMYS